MRIVAFRVHRHRVLTRLAIISSVLAFSGLAGCSSQSSRFDGYGYDNGYSYAATGSLSADYDTVPYNGNGGRYYGASYNGGTGYSNGYGSYGGVSRSGLPPLSETGNGYATGNGYGNRTYADGYGRYNGYSPQGKEYGGHNGNGGYGNGYDTKSLSRRGNYDSGYSKNGYDKSYGAQEKYEDEGENGYQRNGYNGGGKRVTVEPGDTLYALSLQHGVSVDDIIEANGLSGHTIHAGQELIIPGGGNGYRRSSGYHGSSYAAADIRAVGPRRSTSDAHEGCPNCYTVKPGDSLFTIARKHNLGPAHIAHHNKIAVSAKLQPGQQLLIPNGRSGANPASSRPPVRYAASKLETYSRNDAIDSARLLRRGDTTAVPLAAGGQPLKSANGKVANESDVAAAGDTDALSGNRIAAKAPEKLTAGSADEPAASCDDLLANPMPRSGEAFRRPVEGLVISKFGPKEDGTYNDGINISVPKGTPIKAAENGVVTYVGTEISGFGNLILVRHSDDYVSAYAHNDEVRVKRCDIVKRGQVIATAGASGSVAKPQLHFELRRHSKPVDPEQHFASAEP